MNNSEQQIADSLARHAADAPDDHTLLSAVHGRLRRRRTGRAAGAVVLAAAVVATAFTATNTLRTEPEVAQTKPGWHWESYKTAQVQVPDTWNQYIAGPAPCTFLTPKVAVVGRFYDWISRDRYTCETAVYPLDARVPYVWFGDVQEPGTKQYDGGWSEETRLIGGTKVSVLAPNETMRREILDTARPITSTDAYGCTPTDTGRATEIVNAKVDSAEICEYFDGKLIAGSRVPPRRAAQLGQSLTRDAVRPVAKPLPGCVGDGVQTYLVTLHSGTKSWTVRTQHTSCSNKEHPSVIALRTGPHGPSDPSALFDGVGPVTPPQR
ncbi:hypothetical protein E1263_26765 [Kribbella antibiotica]|uniref:Uncharacterized protein n=1 Tax=Kribbella antibiotica TaxID=190195 RepID=A0A4R4ZBY2_9ACTN|nr:hypothetical protein [Kribbella antibiotica]TDD54934.1 hypothetical protein E1263_26765 [Kribbella antibiotica]